MFKVNHLRGSVLVQPSAFLFTFSIECGIISKVRDCWKETAVGILALMPRESMKVLCAIVDALDTFHLQEGLVEWWFEACMFG